MNSNPKKNSNLSCNKKWEKIFVAGQYCFNSLQRPPYGLKLLNEVLNIPWPF